MRFEFHKLREPLVLYLNIIILSVSTLVINFLFLQSEEVVKIRLAPSSVKVDLIVDRV